MKTTILIFVVILLSGFIFRSDLEKMFLPGNKVTQKEKKDKKVEQAQDAPGVSIKEQWDLPGVLKEVSGIVYLGNDQFACVQDETGTIYVYNTASKKMEQEIAFGGAGDYEGIAIKGNTAYVIRADGLLFEVDMQTRRTREHNIGSTLMQNIESLGYDSKNNRLLLAGKDEDPSQASYKGIYAFDLTSNTLLKDAVVQLKLTAQASTGKKGKKGNGIQPSALAVHPLTNEIYMLDGPKARLLIVDDSGKIKSTYELGNNFAQPEGISFSAAGKLYISNEGKKNEANIMAVEIP